MAGLAGEGGDAIVRAISRTFGLDAREALFVEFVSEIAVSELVFVAFLGLLYHLSRVLAGFVSRAYLCKFLLLD